MHTPPNDPSIQQITSDQEIQAQQQANKKANDPYKVLLVTTFLSIIIYGVLFYLFFKGLLNVQTLLTVITIKFLLTIGWSYWARFKNK